MKASKVKDSKTKGFRAKDSKVNESRRAPDKRPQPRMDKRSPYTQQEYVVEGLSAVAEYLRFRPQALTQIACIDTSRREVEKLLAASGVDLPIRNLGKKETGNGEHFRSGSGHNEPLAPVQARVLIKALDAADLEARIDGRSRDIIVALDHITDPRNLGAIVRSAAYFGVREIIAPQRRQVLFTQASVATAQGGFALTDLVCVVNLARTLRSLKDAGYWIVGTAMDGEPLAQIKSVYDKVVLVFGAEDTGLSQNIRELCDRLAAIPTGGGPTLDSLNVSVAAGIFLHEFRLQA